MMRTGPHRLRLCLNSQLLSYSRRMATTHKSLRQSGFLEDPSARPARVHGDEGGGDFPAVLLEHVPAVIGYMTVNTAVRLAERLRAAADICARCDPELSCEGLEAVAAAERKLLAEETALLLDALTFERPS